MPDDELLAAIRQVIERVGPSVYRITERGQQVLVAHPTSIDISVCQQFDEWHQSKTQRAAGGRSLNFEEATAFISAVPPGRWTAYKDVAEASNCQMLWIGA